jgi:anti-sigma B factor antagonist
MAIEVRKAGQVSIVSIKGALRLGESEIALRDKVKDLLDKGERKLILDMTGVPSMDSSGVGQVVACHVRIKNAGGSVKLVQKGWTHDLFVTVQLHRVFDIYEDLEGALGSFVA